MPVCYEHKFIFVHIPKCAGTSVRKALKSAGVRLDFEGPVRPEHQVRYAIDEKWLHHLPAPALKRILPENVWEEFFKFTFVRNPWDRLVSKYHFNKQVHATNPMFRIRRPEWSRALDNSGSFDEWIREALSTSGRSWASLRMKMANCLWTSWAAMKTWSRILDSFATESAFMLNYHMK